LSTRRGKQGRRTPRRGRRRRPRRPKSPAPQSQDAEEEDRDLAAIAKDMSIEGAAAMRKQELIFSILPGADDAERLHQRRGRARDPARRLRLPAARRLQLPPGPTTSTSRRSQDPPLQPAHRRRGRGQIRPPRKASANFALLKVETINFDEPEKARDKILFDNLTPLYPTSTCASIRPRGAHHAHHRSAHADRKGSAGHRRRAAHRQTMMLQKSRTASPPTIPTSSSSCCSSTSGPRSDRHAALVKGEV